MNCPRCNNEMNSWSFLEMRGHLCESGCEIRFDIDSGFFEGQRTEVWKTNDGFETTDLEELKRFLKIRSFQ